MTKKVIATQKITKTKKGKVEEDKMFEVVYFSRGGNTKKVAAAIAEELGTAARDIRAVDKVEENSTILLGTGCYGAVVAKDIMDFIERNRLQGRKIALFTTSLLGLGQEVTLMEKQIRDKGVEITEHFDCAGSFLGMKKGHPNADDLEKAREFARGIAFTEHYLKQNPLIKQSVGAAV
jgi:flavodoxin